TTLVVVRLGDQTVGYPLTDIIEAGAINDTVGGHEIAVVAQGHGQSAWAVYSRRIGNATPKLELVGSHLVDPETGTEWDTVNRPPARSPPDAPALVPLPSVPVEKNDLHRLWPGAVIRVEELTGQP
ncbi:MAG: DUF3179 domain-containing protein, partial [bacterium]|nr:DUF3179 domain-containing protein [bacterium]